MKRILIITSLVLLLAGIAFAQFGGGPFGTDLCEFGIGPFGDCNPAPGAAHGDSLLLEDGEYLLTEDGDTLLLE